MARPPYETPIDRDSTREHLELCIIDAARNSDPNRQRAAARAQAELSRRDREDQRELLELQRGERLEAQQFQEAHTKKQLEVADQQATSARRAMWAAWVAAGAAICLLFLTATQIFSSEPPRSDPAPAEATRVPAY